MIKRYFKFIVHLLAMLTVFAATAGSYDDLFIAVIRDDPRSLKKLFAQGMDPNTRDEKGMPALMVAIRRESTQAFDALLAHPAIDPDAANAADETALMLTAIAGDMEASQKLLARGAKVQRPD